MKRKIINFDTTASRKILILELWGLGDLTFTTSFIEAAAIANSEVHLMGKDHAESLLGPSFPDLHFVEFDAPWTVHRGKYSFWKWNWVQISRMILRLRAEKYDVCVSVRNDPRDQILMWLIGAKERAGFFLEGRRRFFDAGRLFLTRRLKRPREKQHKVEDWHQLGLSINLPMPPVTGVWLDHESYRTGRVDELFAKASKPVICLHTGARNAVRRWPEQYFAAVIRRLRKVFDFHLIVIPEPTGGTPVLTEIADSFVTSLSVGEMVDLLGRVDLLICNDSGPAHVAAGCGSNVISIFGPSDPDWFRPWGEQNRVILSNMCDYRPCFDDCKFAEAHCMTKLTPEIAYPEIEQYVSGLFTKLPAVAQSARAAH